MVKTVAYKCVKSKLGVVAKLSNLCRLMNIVIMFSNKYRPIWNGYIYQHLYKDNNGYTKGITDYNVHTKTLKWRKKRFIKDNYNTRLYTTVVSYKYNHKHL